MEAWTLDKSLTCALALALSKKDDGLLFPSGVDFDELDWSFGDPETIYSIASLYADFEENDGTWRDEIEKLLLNELPDYE